MDEVKRVIGRPFQKGNAGKPKGTTHKLTQTVKELMAEFNKKAFPKLLARQDELTMKELAQVVCAFQNYIEPAKKQLEVTRTNQIEVPKEIAALSFEQLEQIQNIISGTQPSYKLIEGTTA
jgi:hypothetical protein